MPTRKSEEFQDRLDEVIGEYADQLNVAELFGSVALVGFLWLMGSVERVPDAGDGPDPEDEDDDDDPSEAWKRGSGDG